jgi:ribosome-associated protein
VNKVNSRVSIRLPVDALYFLDERQKQRLRGLAGDKMTTDDEVLLSVQQERSQHRNREIAFHRLAALIKNAQTKRKTRKKTRPPGRAQERRLNRKKKRGEQKRQRKKPDSSDID